MTSRFAAWLLVGALIGVPVAAAPSTASPLVGEWTLDVATLPMPPELRPKRVALSFRDGSDGRWSTQVEIIDAKGTRLHSSSTVALDGTTGRATGTYQVDVVAAKMPEPNVLVMQFVYEGIPRSTRVYSVSGDGAVLTETEVYFRDGAPVLRTAHFTRAAGNP
ncbi:LuxR family transcriptional regulator [Mitsuaria sp. 7]|uniref:LuxR family transcriptional regulator n=1 Tax=Mitsuaria sp. 7 TaxID=1658665 RepID=UPI0007DD2F34|nr:LuxR family transcriptional regulator [Mitsuaria sp. 7]ANH67439.1 LuxR family transcriptional regulator [Mitsuaria sp. 7]